MTPEDAPPELRPETMDVEQWCPPEHRHESYLQRYQAAWGAYFDATEAWCAANDVDDRAWMRHHFPSWG